MKNTPKTALGAARIALLAGASAAALSFSMSAAHADDVFVYGNPYSILFNATGPAMLQFNGVNNQTTQMGSAFNISVDGTTQEGGFKTTDFTGQMARRQELAFKPTATRALQHSQGRA